MNGSDGDRIIDFPFNFPEASSENSVSRITSSEVSSSMSFAKFKLLLWKNYAIQKRSPIGFVFEIIFPVCLVLVLACVRDLNEPITRKGFRFKAFQPLPFGEWE